GGCVSDVEGVEKGNGVGGGNTENQGLFVPLIKKKFFPLVGAEGVFRQIDGLDKKKVNPAGENLAPPPPPEKRKSWNCLRESKELR
ncbi:MAG: hypothetical protein WCH86_06560, partial [Kiritimatiellales bacterium]